MKATVLAALVLLASCASVEPPPAKAPRDERSETQHSSPERGLAMNQEAVKTNDSLDLGAFTLSLAVKDLAASRAFYAKLGFQVVGGDAAQNWLVLQNGTTKIGIFQGMFEKNMLTFNPGWSSEREHLEGFDDVRKIQRVLEGHGLELQTRAEEQTTGPAHLVVVDPDGNPILVDQHVDSR
jgi:lactoylglutathione lyase